LSRLFKIEELNRLKLSEPWRQRKRCSLNLHETFSDKCQIFFNLLSRETQIQPHYYQGANASEYIIIISGKVCVYFFTIDGEVSEKTHLTVDNNVAVRVDSEQIHTVVCESSEALILEAKSGPFKQELSKNFPDWSEEFLNKFWARAHE
jgi:cupin fold WbuC family metalloprotein